ncbi:putative tartrate transporter [compost metagenome]
MGIAVINAVGNIGSAVNPLVVGWLKDLTQSFGSGFAYAAILMILGALLALRLPIATPEAPGPER